MTKRHPKNRPTPSRAGSRPGAAFGVTRSSDRAPQQPALHDELAQLLTKPSPVDLLVYASTMVAALEVGPMEHPDPDRPTVTSLIDMFREAAGPQTDALLRVLVRLLGDDTLTARVDRDVAARRPRHPGWMDKLDDIRPTRAFRFGHVLGDGENLLLEVALPSGALTLLLYIDHNRGTVVKDAFPVEAPLAEVVDRLTRLAADAADEQVASEPSLADARAMIAQAVRSGRFTYPPFESDTWPATRALVEWMLRLLPAGGEDYDDRLVERDEDQMGLLATDFIISPHAVGLDRDPDGEDADIAQTLLWLAMEHLGGDPLRWSAVSVEIVLLDLVPRKIMADGAYLRRVPRVLRHLVRWAHASRGIPSHLTVDVLGAIDEFEPAYRDAVTAPRRQGAEALLERIGALPPLEDDLSDEDYFAEILDDAVGGRAALEALDTRPLPEEPLRTDDLPEDIVERVRVVGRLAGDAAQALFSSEMRTVVHRVLARVAAGDPAIFRRRSKDEMTAAAVLWIAATVNDELHAWRGSVTTGELMAQLGQKGHPGQRAEPMLRALGVERVSGWSYNGSLGDPDLLTSTRRAAILDRWHSCDA